eukprot:TRINITY_DN5964_c0_g1_i1.p2 TRINITY_DN5964_c0_g1~~TRINITY_DN5964_c0_g1_i1.p2  ORF type:complete len:69 (-),score=0.09 TRINITY_DN5964_c0_g1_i1:144-350(-)
MEAGLCVFPVDGHEQRCPLWPRTAFQKLDLTCSLSAMKMEFSDLGIAVGYSEPGLIQTPMVDAWLDKK